MKTCMVAPRAHIGAAPSAASLQQGHRVQEHVAGRSLGRACGIPCAFTTMSAPAYEGKVTCFGLAAP